jgi:translation initiation factor eIF-2B subunit beta
VRRVLHIIREEEASLETKTMADVSNAVESDDENEDKPSRVSAVVVAAANKSVMRAPSLHTLLESLPPDGATNIKELSIGDSEGKSKCKLILCHIVEL